MTRGGVLLLLLLAAASAALVPEQIHLAFGATPDYVAVQWATTETFCTAGSDVQFGLVDDALDREASGACFPFNVSSEQVQQSNHWANMTGLDARTRYFYRVGDKAAGTWSSVFHFRTNVDAATLPDALPQKFLVWGDLGSTNSPPVGTTTIMPYTSAEIAEAFDVDMILHVGDFAYDFDSQNGDTGRVFMNDIQNMSAYVPYHVSVGNHEAGFTFAHYTEFFRSQPSDTPWVTTDNGEAPNNWWFSWNVGLVHFVTLSSEVVFNSPNTLNADQWSWLQADLAAANANRTVAPWIVVNAHRSIYCSCDGDCDSAATQFRAGVAQDDGSLLYGYEQLFYEFGVDLFINGHEHNYERMYDVAPAEDGTWLSGNTTQTTVDMPATTYIVTGDAGNSENYETFVRPKPDRVAFRMAAYGYSRMDVHNDTHLHWQQVLTDTRKYPHHAGDVVDDVWLVQHYHGSFSERAAARNHAATATA